MADRNIAVATSVGAVLPAGEPVTRNLPGPRKALIREEVPVAPISWYQLPWLTSNTAFDPRSSAPATER